MAHKMKSFKILGAAFVANTLPGNGFQMLPAATSAGSFVSTHNQRLAMSTTSEEEVDSLIQEAKNTLYAAAETKAEDSDKVVGALLDLEKLMRKKNKGDVQQMEETVGVLLSSFS